MPDLVRRSIRILAPTAAFWMLALVLGQALPSPALAQKEFGFDNRKATGQPYLRPEESLKRFKVAPGWEISLFAAEPDVINPVAMTVDEKGRVWVVENFEYPRRTPKGQKPKDRIKILEDTDGDGKADKVTVWAEGKDLPTSWDLATGIEVGHDGVFLGAAPYLFFLRDTTGKGKCDRQEILLKGFGSEDTHETLNTFQWGPDSKLYGLHGIFTRSVVNGVKLNAAVWRYDPLAKHFEVFAEGTSNPWGMDFDSHGQCHLVCCVIPHMFHMVPGGTYIRQAGTSFNPYAYGLLRQSCDHTHHKESGWAHAGLIYLDGDHVPEEYRGSLLMGSIHGSSIKRDVLRRAGSTFIAGHAPDLAVSGDKNFRPINLRWAPDGSIYVIDWHDQNPCHQADPGSWDYRHGRIYRIHRKGQQKFPPPGDLSKLHSKQLVELLKKDNPWWYRTAIRLLHERKDKSVAPLLETMALNSDRETHALRAVWALYGIGALDERIGAKLLAHKNLWVRSWAVRLLGEAGQVSGPVLERFTRMAAEDAAPEVRLQLASTAQRLNKQVVLPLLHNLMKHKEDAGDSFLPLMIWLAYEPRVAEHHNPALDWLRHNAAGNPLVVQEIVPRTLRRLASTGKAEDLAACVEFLGAVTDSQVRRQGLEGMVAALKGRQVTPPSQWRQVFAALEQDGDNAVRQLARKLAVNFHDPRAIQLALKVAADLSQETPKRISAIQDLSLTQPREALPVLLAVVANSQDVLPVRMEACRALGAFDDNNVPATVLAGWKDYLPQLRNEAVNLLSGRKTWASQLLDAVGKKRVAAADLTNNIILRIRAFHDARLDKQIAQVWGQIRDTPADLARLIDKMRGELAKGSGSFAKGRKVFENNCAKCHKFEGMGHEVGPNLEGAGRDIEYLLVNILDPNRVVGQPYFTRIVELKDGRIETGLLAAEDEQTITLKGENNALKVIPRANIQGKVLVEPKSLMPEGLDKNMTVQDFRDLVTYLMASPFLTHVETAGPFPAAKAPIPNAVPPSQWHKFAAGVTGRIPLAAGSSPDQQAVNYVRAQVKVGKTMSTRLLLGAGPGVGVWLNGKLIYRSKPGKNAPAPDHHSVPVLLQSGINRIILEVSYRDRTALFARLLDPNRELREVESEAQ
jgi:putative membrane-bound dehydrogenase-like protein